jgi:hypothetical protein
VTRTLIRARSVVEGEAKIGGGEPSEEDEFAPGLVGAVDCAAITFLRKANHFRKKKRGRLT